MKSEFLIVAKMLMEREQRAMSPRELVRLGIDRQLFSDKIAGQTPDQTMKAKLSVHIRRLGQNSEFVRTEPGRFFLRHLLERDTEPFEAEPIVPPPSTESVLVYKTSELDKLTTWQGLSTSGAWRKVARTLFRHLRPNFRKRFDVEEDNDYTQILTYVLVTRGEAILAYRRGTYNRTERYLRGAFCVGFGGHVTEVDFNLFNTDLEGILESAARELIEEIQLPDGDVHRLRKHEGLEVIGMINDDSSDVGRRHLAFVVDYEVSEARGWDQPKRGEKAITQTHWISSTKAAQVALWNFEYWSQLCLREFRPQLVRAGPTYRLVRRAPLRPPHVVCMMGPVGSGKTIAAGILKRDFGYQEINSGEVLASILKIHPVTAVKREEFQRRAWEFISEGSGPVRLGRKIADVVASMESDRIVVDGIRQEKTLEVLKAIMGRRRLGIVFVQTPVDLAFRFYFRRLSRNATMADFLAARGAPVEQEVEHFIAKADAVLYNWTGSLRYRDTIRGMMKELGVSRRRKS